MPLDYRPSCSLNASPSTKLSSAPIKTTRVYQRGPACQLAVPMLALAESRSQWGSGAYRGD